jgi:hypothetical protein
MYFKHTLPVMFNHLPTNLNTQQSKQSEFSMKKTAKHAFI